MWSLCAHTARRCGRGNARMTLTGPPCCDRTVRVAFHTHIQQGAADRKARNGTVPSSSRSQQLWPAGQRARLSYPLFFEILLFLKRKTVTWYPKQHHRRRTLPQRQRGAAVPKPRSAQARSGLLALRGGKWSAPRPGPGAQHSLSTKALHSSRS